MAPFFVIDNLLPDLDSRVGINALHRYVKDNLQGEYELEELLNGPLVPRTPLRLPLTHDNIIRHQAELGETVRQVTEDRRIMGFESSQSSAISEPRAKRKKI